MLANADRAGLRIVSLRKRGRWDVIPFLFRLVRELRANRADIVHGYLGMANALLILTKPIHRARVAWGCAHRISISPGTVGWPGSTPGWRAR